MNIVQIIDSKGKRRVGLAAGAQVVLLKKVATTLDLAKLALKEGKSLSAMASSLAGTATEDYAKALKEKRVLTPVDHPDPAHCIITGTGLTHLGSAAARDGMHKKLSGAKEELTDSLKMFKLGLEGGKPKSKAEAGVQPEWFYKGDGSWLVGPGPAAAASLLRARWRRGAGTGRPLSDRRQGHGPVRLGFALGNEYSDHVTERQNYLYLAHSKLRHSSIGPEMVTGKIPGLGRGHEPHPPRRQGDLGEALPDGRGQHEPHHRQPRIPPLQV